MRRENEYVVFDLETTGLSTFSDAIMQIAAVRMRNGHVDETSPFFSYVNPGRPIPPWLCIYTGISDKDVADAPRAHTVLRRFSEYVGSAHLVAHNGHRFDMKFLASECIRHRLPTRPVTYYDTIALSQLLWGTNTVRHSLDAVLGRLRISPRGYKRHDARGDVSLLALAVQRMWLLLEDRRLQPAIRCYSGILPTA